jgi:hypothetical protein
MSACSRYLRRFKSALKFRGLKYPEDIIITMGKRAKTDSSLDNILMNTALILEPPSCTKSHCPHFTTMSFCNCSIERIPGKCDLHLAYRKRVKERQEKQYQERLAQVPKKFLPLSPENEKRVRETDKYTWAKFLKTK